MRQYQSKKTFSVVPDNLKAIRGGLSQAEFAGFLEIPNQVTYHRYENGRVPKAHVLQQIASRLGISVDELLAPISHERAHEIAVLSIVNAPLPKSPKEKLTAATAEAFGKAAGELVNPKSMKAVLDAFQIEKLSHDEVSRLFSHIVSVSNRAPVELMKYYVLIRVAIGKELARRWKIK